MTDPLDKFRRTLADAPTPEVDKLLENQSIEKAMAAFDKKNATAAKGNRFWLRLMDTARSVLQPNDGVSMKRTYQIAGGLCAATLAIALISTTSLNQDFQIAKKAELKEAAKIAVNDGMTREPQKAVLEAQMAATPPAPLAMPSVSIPAPMVEGLVQGAASVPQEAEQLFAGRNVSEAKAKQVMNKAEMPAGLAGASIASDMIVHPGYKDQGRDKFEHVKDNALKLVKEEPVSTFSIDVDTASYSFMRASLNNNVLPQKDSVRVEEMINYFPYEYAAPKDKETPFANHVTVTPSPWNKSTKLVHIGIKGYEIEQKEKPHSNLVFLIDTSGSMDEPNKLPLLKNSMKMLLNSLQPEDTIAIVTYAGSAGVALEPTKVRDTQKILSTIDNFNAGGSTAGAEGIRQAYQLAEQNFDKKGVNRVILATDGDFNVGITDPNELKSFIERKRDTGIFLSVLGFGQGNYNDALMQTLAQNGNGNAAYIDNLNEARKVLVDEASATLFTIAKDVKIQVEFNPAKVSEYRLIGYETRMLNREDFNNDKIDAGEIGAGHTVTAIYEITPTKNEANQVDPLRYGGEEEKPVFAPSKDNNEYAFLKIRYKLPKEEKSKLITTPIDAKVEVPNLNAASEDARFSIAVAGFGQLLRGASYTQNFTYQDVLTLAQTAKGQDEFGYRAEFLNLVRLAQSAAGMQPLENGQRPLPIVMPPHPAH